MICLHVCYIFRYLAYLCRVQKKQHWLSLRWESGYLGNRHRTGDVSLYSEFCEHTNYSKEPDKVAGDCNPGPWVAEEGRLLSSRQSGLHITFFRLACVIL